MPRAPTPPPNVAAPSSARDGSEAVPRVPAPLRATLADRLHTPHRNLAPSARSRRLAGEVATRTAERLLRSSCPTQTVRTATGECPCKTESAPSSTSRPREPPPELPIRAPRILRRPPPDSAVPRPSRYTDRLIKSSETSLSKTACASSQKHTGNTRQKVRTSPVSIWNISPTQKHNIHLPKNDPRRSARALTPTIAVFTASSASNPRMPGLDQHREIHVVRDNRLSRSNVYTAASCSRCRGTFAPDAPQ